MSKYKPPFQIGDWVKVRAIASMGYDSYCGATQTKSLRTYKTEQIGQICGAVYRYEGKRTSGWSYDAPPEWTAQRAYLLWQVKTNILGKPLEALEEDIDLIDFQEYIYPDTIPFRAPQPKWKQEWKDSLRNEMKDWPRDSKGRWTKWHK